MLWNVLPLGTTSCLVTLPMFMFLFTPVFFLNSSRTFVFAAAFLTPIHLTIFINLVRETWNIIPWQENRLVAHLHSLSTLFIYYIPVFYSLSASCISWNYIFHWGIHPVVLVVSNRQAEPSCQGFDRPERATLTLAHQQSFLFGNDLTPL